MPAIAHPGCVQRHVVSAASLAAPDSGREGIGSGQRSGAPMQSLDQGLPNTTAQQLAPLLSRMRTVFRPAVAEVLRSLDCDNFARFRRTADMTKVVQVVLRNRALPGAAPT